MSLRAYLSVARANVRKKDNLSSLSGLIKSSQGLIRHSDSRSWTARPNADSDTALIFGTGPSINGISQEFWSKASDYLTVGLNYFTIHDFRPSFFSFEWHTREIKAWEILHRGPRFDHSRFLYPIPIRNSRLQNDHFLDDFVPRNQLRTELYSRIFYTKPQAQNLMRQTITICQAQQMGLLKPGIWLDSGPSITRIVSGLLFAGVKRVILVGVDLNTNEHFWHHSPDWLREKTLPLDFLKPTEPRKFHETQTKTQVVEKLEILAKAARTIFGASILVQNPDSLLSKVLPVADV